MKPKCHGITTVAITLVLFGAIAGYYLSDSWRMPPPDPGFQHTGGEPVHVPSPEQAKTMRRLEPLLPRLAFPSAKDEASPVSMTLFGYTPDDTTMSDKDSNSHDGAREGQYTLSMTLLAGANRYCVVDDLFLAQGSRLPDGGIVQRIENKRVQIITRQAVIWVPISDGASAHGIPASGKGQS